MQNIQEEKDNINLETYRSGSLTLLQLMSVLAILGVLATWVLWHFFIS